MNLLCYTMVSSTVFFPLIQSIDDHIWCGSIPILRDFQWLHPHWYPNFNHFVWTCLKMRCAIKLKCLEGKMLMNQLICSNKLKDHIKISWGHTHLIAKWKSWWFISPIGNIMVNPIIATPVWAELAIPGIGSFKMTPVAVWWPRCPRICHMKVATIQTVKRCDGSKPTRQSVGLIYI